MAPHGQLAMAGRRPGSRGCCKQWIQDRETYHSTRWRSGEPRRASGGGSVATTRGWTVVECRPGGRYFKYRPPPRLLLAVGSEMCGRGSTGDCSDQQGSRAGRRPQAGQARGLRGAPWRRDLAAVCGEVRRGSLAVALSREQRRSFRPPGSFRVLALVK